MPYPGREVKTWPFVLLIATLVFGLTATVSAYQVEKVNNGGAISGKVLFQGTPPARTMLKATKDTKVCGKEVPSDALVVGPNKGVQWAIVSLEISKGNGLEKKAKVILDQHGCRYLPHVVRMPVGGTLTVLNSDGVLHNIHTYSRANKSVNKAQPKFKKKLRIRRIFKKPELIKMRCDAHSWMSGFILVQNHPYNAVSGTDGSFKLTDVPPGTYKLKVWHEKLGTVTKEVKVEAGKETTLNFDLAM